MDRVSSVLNKLLETNVEDEELSELMNETRDAIQSVGEFNYLMEFMRLYDAAVSEGEDKIAKRIAIEFQELADRWMYQPLDTNNVRDVLDDMNRERLYELTVNACRDGDSKLIHWLVDHGVSIPVNGAMYLAYDGNYDLVRYLVVECGFPYDRQHVIDSARKGGHQEIVELLQ